MKYLKNIVHKLFRASGYDFRRYTSKNFVSLRREKILDSKSIDLVIDIGASEGKFPKNLRQTGYQGHFISFEPLPQSFALLKKNTSSDPLWDCENIALGHFDGTIDMNVSGRKTSSSILPMTEAHIRAMPSSRYVDKVRVKVTRLDALVNKIKWAKNLYIKIDVQGFEKQVLQGAFETLNRTRALEIELSLEPMYRGGMLLQDALDYLDRKGFKLVSIEPAFSDPETGYMLQVDGIFIKRV
jgi:FkbM family methyltransferase